MTGMTGMTGPWQPLDRDAVAALLAPAGIRWWFTGGHALELHLGSTWRDHDDVDVGILRSDVPAFAAALDEWDVQLAAAGRLHPLPSRPLRVDRHENNLWVRRRPSDPWSLDVVVSEGGGTSWVYRRRPEIRVPWADAVLTGPEGTPYLAPELQLLFKAVDRREKDDVDAAVVIPRLDGARRSRLSGWIGPEHPWQGLLV